MFARRMLEMEGDSQYADVMERALYNTVLGGMALDGKHFFYVNPLEVHPKSLKFDGLYQITLNRSASVGLAALVVRQISPAC